MTESAPLKGQCIAIPESRQLDILADLVLARGARVLRLPLVSILDAPDQRPVVAWLERFIADRPDLLIILTGEGLRRLLVASERIGCRDQFIKALGEVLKICRGPKPGRALKEIELKPDLLGAEPTTAGIISSLEGMSVEGRRVAVQLYGEDPNRLLIDYLERRGAVTDTVAPYIYAPQTAEDAVVQFIDSLATGEVTSIMFTSQPQYKRLAEVAVRHDRQDRLKEGLAGLRVVAVGPVVAGQLESAGVAVHAMPETSFFMKPMVTALVEVLRADGESGA